MSCFSLWRAGITHMSNQAQSSNLFLKVNFSNLGPSLSLRMHLYLWETAGPPLPAGRETFWIQGPVPVSLISPPLFKLWQSLFKKAEMMSGRELAEWTWAKKIEKVGKRKDKTTLCIWEAQSGLSCKAMIVPFPFLVFILIRGLPKSTGLASTCDNPISVPGEWDCRHAPLWLV